ncbi:hypothetical protein SSTU70S_00686 [Stutzerimonas stutzeri]
MSAMPSLANSWRPGGRTGRGRDATGAGRLGPPWRPGRNASTAREPLARHATVSVTSRQAGGPAPRCRCPVCGSSRCRRPRARYLRQLLIPAWTLGVVLHHLGGWHVVAAGPAAGHRRHDGTVASASSPKRGAGRKSAFMAVPQRTRMRWRPACRCACGGASGIQLVPAQRLRQALAHRRVGPEGFPRGEGR